MDKQDLGNMRKRFVSDFKLPIPVTEDPYWDFYLDLYEEPMKSRTNWKRLNKYDPSKFLAEYYEVRERMIRFIQDSRGYKEFQEAPLENLKYPKEDIYNEGRVGKCYLGIDLEKANFQVLRKYIQFTEEKINPTADWERWVEDMVESKDPTLTWYIKQSKYIRQVVFGNCNPGRQINLERSMIYGVTKCFRDDNLELIQLGNDEACFEIINPEKFVMEEGLKERILEQTGIYVGATKFKLTSKAFLTPGGHTIRAYCKEVDNGEKIWKGISGHYYAQIYELLNGIEPDKEGRDLVFYNEKELAKFIGRLKII